MPARAPVVPMRLLDRVFALLLVALWLPAVEHCGLEAIGGTSVEAPGCCSHDDPGSADVEGACVNDHCGIFDDGHFRAEQDGSPRAEAGLLAAFVQAEVWHEPESGAPVKRARTGEPPPAGWSCRWLFELRAAPLANAPGSTVG